MCETYTFHNIPWVPLYDLIFSVTDNPVIEFLDKNFKTQDLETVFEGRYYVNPSV